MNDSDKDPIKQVAKDNEIYNLTEDEIQRAYDFASDAAAEDFYYRLKEYFLN